MTNCWTRLIYFCILLCWTIVSAGLQTFESVIVNNDRVTVCYTGDGGGVVLSSIVAGDACECGVGFEGSSLETGCTPCVSGKYKDNVGFELCVNCPVYETSLVGAASSECVCMHGFERNSDNSEDNIICTECEVGFYKDYVGDNACVRCFAYSTSALGSVSGDACQCLEGYTANVNNVNPDTYAYDETCVPCGGQHFKDIVGMQACTPCRDNAETGGAAISALECMCSPGYFESDGLCIECQKGYYNMSWASRRIRDHCGDW
jgi:hypothetical protein